EPGRLHALLVCRGRRVRPPRGHGLTAGRGAPVQPRGAGVVPAHLRRRALRHRNRCRLRGTVLPARPACPGGLRRVSPHAFSLTSRAAVPLNWPTIPSPSAGAVVRRGGTRHTKETLVATTNDLKNGIVLKMNNELWKELEFKHDKPDNGAAFMRTQIKNITS